MILKKRWYVRLALWNNRYGVCTVFCTLGITFAKTLKCSYTYMNILMDFNTIPMIVAGSGSLIHITGYNQIHCKNMSVKSNFSMVSFMFVFILFHIVLKIILIVSKQCCHSLHRKTSSPPFAEQVWLQSHTSSSGLLGCTENSWRRGTWFLPLHSVSEKF